MERDGHNKMNDIPARKYLRLKDYNYSQSGAYYITICTKDRHDILGKIIAEDTPGTPYVELPNRIAIELSEFGEIVRKYIDSIPNSNPDVTVSQYVIMPNHIHIILMIYLKEIGGTPKAASPTNTIIPKTINALKGLSSKASGFSLWQRSYYNAFLKSLAEIRLAVHRFISWVNQNKDIVVDRLCLQY